jgi:hypothetical protein
MRERLFSNVYWLYTLILRHSLYFCPLKWGSLENYFTLTEKIWDALERLKTYYVVYNKKNSVKKIVNDMANGQEDFVNLFNTEFKALTDIGNDYRIRHHETNKIDITDSRYYDYFFNRCLSLMALSVQYLE